MFPRITSYLGYRWTFRLGTLVFAAVCMVLPFSNQITGSVPMPASTTCGSGSGFESGWQNTDYCGNILDASSNEHSVLRIPAYIWIFVIGIASLIAMSRCVIAFLNAHVHMCSYLATWAGCFSKTIIHINLSHVGRGYSLCVCL